MTASFQEKLQHALQQVIELPTHHRVLFAISGGADSVALLDSMVEAGYTGMVAHMNFQLRGEESEKDERFVRQLAAAFQLPIEVRRVNTEEYARQRGISIEMAARDLRYPWFFKLIKQHQLDAIALGHHLNDAIETFHINLLRGTGLRGLKGIAPRNRQLVRPLLSITRDEIESYCQARELPWRHDHTNDSTEIIRNKLRHDVLPQFKEMQPAYEQVMSQNMEHFYQSLELLQDHIRMTLKYVSVKQPPFIYFQIDKILRLRHPKYYLYEFFSHYNFHADVLEQLHESLHTPGGKQFMAPRHRIVKDRNQLILSPLPRRDTPEFQVPDAQATVPVEDVFGTRSRFFFEPMSRGAVIKKNRNRQTAVLDISRLQFPLTIRHWQAGDRFSPLGVPGSKKLKDFFVDEKLPIPEKERTWLVVSGQDIVWVVGYRIHNDYRLKRNTEQVLRISVARG